MCSHGFHWKASCSFFVLSRYIITWLKGLPIILSILAIDQASAQRLDDIVAKHIEAMGGYGRLSKLKSLRYKTEFLIDSGFYANIRKSVGADTALKAGNLLGTVETTILHKKAILIETTRRLKAFTMAFSNDSGWMAIYSISGGLLEVHSLKQKSDFGNFVDLEWDLTGL